MASTDATFVPVKNQAYRWTFVILEADADPVVGAAGLDSERSLDGAAFADCTNEATEVAQGVYYLDLTAAEMNADTVVVVVKSSTTGAKYAYGIFTPQEAGTELKADATHGAGTAFAAAVRAAVGLASANLDTVLTAIDDFLDTEIAAIKAKTDNLPADPADASDIATSFTTVNTKLDTIDDFLDTEIAAILAAVDTEVGAIKTVTDQLVAAQAEPTAVPAANATPLAKLAWLAMMARNKRTTTATQDKVFADNGTDVLGTSTISDDGTTATLGEYA